MSSGIENIRMRQLESDNRGLRQTILAKDQLIERLERELSRAHLLLAVRADQRMSDNAVPLARIVPDER